MESFKEWRTTFDEERRREVEKAGKGKEGAATTSRRLTGEKGYSLTTDIRVCICIDYRSADV